MNKLIKLGLVSLLVLPIVGCAKQDKLVSEILILQTKQRKLKITQQLQTTLK